MRLIDADKIGGVSADPYEEGAFQDEIRSQPTVEAIPIDWIERWLDRVTGTRDGDDISKYHDIVKGGIMFINMVERDWEKENGISQ